MRTPILAAIALSLPLVAQDIDYKFLDKLADKAKESSVVDMGPEQMGLVRGMFGANKKDELGEVARQVRSVQVRSYEFERDGDYSMDEVRAFRDRVKASGNWLTVVSTREKHEFTDILVRKGPDGKPAGFLIISAERRELSIVHVVGSLDFSQLGRLGGQFGVPQIEAAREKEREAREKAREKEREAREKIREKEREAREKAREAREKAREKMDEKDEDEK
jgi:hypothetical protein